MRVSNYGAGGPLHGEPATADLRAAAPRGAPAGAPASRRRRWVGLWSAAALAATLLSACSSTPSTTSAGTSSKSLTTVKLEIANPGASFLPFYLGRDDGIFAKKGITLQIDVLTPTASAVAATVGGSVPFASAIGPYILAAIKGEPLRILEVGAVKTDFVLVGKMGLTSVSQLKGQTVVGESAISTINKVEESMLAHFNVTPSSVSFVNQTGGDAARAALVEAGKASATLVEYDTWLKDMHNYPLLAKDDYEVQMLTGLAASETEIHDHPGLVRRLVTATIQATNVVRTNEAASVKVEMEQLGLTKAEAQANWLYMKGGWTVGGRPSAAAVKAELTVDQKALNLTAPPTLGEFADFSFLPKAKT